MYHQFLLQPHTVIHQSCCMLMDHCKNIAGTPVYVIISNHISCKSRNQLCSMGGILVSMRCFSGLNGHDASHHNLFVMSIIRPGIVPKHHKVAEAKKTDDDCVMSIEDKTYPLPSIWELAMVSCPAYGCICHSTCLFFTFHRLLPHSILCHTPSPLGNIHFLT